MRLLIVEDDEALRTSLCAGLAEAGFVVNSAADGDEGLFQATEYPVDVAIVDLGLPVTMQDVDVALRASFEQIFGPTRTP